MGGWQPQFAHAVGLLHSEVEWSTPQQLAAMQVPAVHKQKRHAYPQCVSPILERNALMTQETRSVFVGLPAWGKLQLELPAAYQGTRKAFTKATKALTPAATPFRVHQRFDLTSYSLDGLRSDALLTR